MNKLIFGFVVVSVILRLSNGRISSCSDILPCITYHEGKCVGGQREVCIRGNPMGAGCALQPNEIFDSICAQTAENSAISSSKVFEIPSPSCHTADGGSEVIFSIIDNAVASREPLIEANVARLTGGTVAANCVMSSSRINVCHPKRRRPTLWTFPVAACTCTCPDWSTWSTCDSRCLRTRSRICVGPSDLNCGTETESEDCVAGEGNCLGCSCSTDWSDWTSCVGGSRSRTKLCRPIVNDETCEDILSAGLCESGHNGC